MKMRKAVNRLRQSLHYRRERFSRGLATAGFSPTDDLSVPEPGDVLLIWNRYTGYDEQAQFWESKGGTVLVAENGYLGKHWRGQEWFSLALGHHAGAGDWQNGGPARWDSWQVDLAPWRVGGTETLIFGQRGIGEKGIAAPSGWAERVQRSIGGRIRPHPGKEPPRVALTDDLEKVQQVVTWNSSAALTALLEGVPVWYGFPQWVGAGAGRPLSEWPGLPKRVDADRLGMFRRLAWTIWTIEEIENGKAFSHLLGS